MAIIAAVRGFAILSLSVGAAAWAADPAGAEINDDTLKLEWAGGGPYVVPNLTPFAGEPVPIVCEPAVPVTCDEFALTVNLTDEFRELPENQRESARIGISFPVTTSLEDYDLYVFDSAGGLVAMSDGLMGVQESVTVPLKTLKNGAYTVQIIPFTPMATNYTGLAQVGKDAEAAKGFSLAPVAGSAPLTVQFDARGLGRGAAPAGGYRFDFGDGSAPLTDADGVVEHAYEQNGEYLSKVSFADASGGKALAGGAQTVYVGEPVSAGKSGGMLGGAFGFAGLLGLLALGLARRVQR